MKYIYTFLIFIGLSSSAFGGVGDFYYCTSYYHLLIDVDFLGERDKDDSYPPVYVQRMKAGDPMKFKWGSSRITFEKENYKDTKEIVKRYFTRKGVKEHFYAEGNSVSWEFNDGTIIENAPNNAIVMYKCSKF